MSKLTKHQEQVITDSLFITKLEAELIREAMKHLIFLSHYFSHVTDSSECKALEGARKISTLLKEVHERSDYKTQEALEAYEELELRALHMEYGRTMEEINETMESSPNVFATVKNGLDAIVSKKPYKVH